MSVRVIDLRRWLDNLLDDDPVYIDDGGLTLRVAGQTAYYEVGGHSEDDEDTCAPITHCGQPDCPICKAVGLTVPMNSDDTPDAYLANCVNPDCPVCQMLSDLPPTVDGDDEPPGEVVIVPKENP